MAKVGHDRVQIKLEAVLSEHKRGEVKAICMGVLRNVTQKGKSRD